MSYEIGSIVFVDLSDNDIKNLTSYYNTHKIENDKEYIIISTEDDSDGTLYELADRDNDVLGCQFNEWELKLVH